MQESSLKDNVTLLKFDNKEIYLVGTAHISQVSADLAEEVIREIKPDSVAVELCDSRYQSLKDPERWKNTDIISVIKAGKIYVLLAQLILASFQKKLGKQLNIQPGAEMLRAIKVANELNARIVLADREVRITLKRVWANVGLWGGAKIITALFSALFSNEKISSEEIEKLKTEDSLNTALNEFSEKLPNVRKPLIDERDQYLAAKIAQAPGSKVVAIIGAGHIPGIKKHIEEKINLAGLEVEPPKSTTTKLIGLALPAIIIGLLIYGFIAIDYNTSINMIESWFWRTGIMAALGAAVVFSHPLTILSAFLAAPVTTLHPVIAAGMVSGLVEAYLRKPMVSDFENITDDISNLRGLWTNRVSRIILVMGFTNIFAMIGMIWGAKVLA